jgi:hypothetical protein
MNKLSRRSFARNTVIAAAAAAVAPNLLAEEKPPALPAASQAEVDARVQWILGKYGARLDEVQRADVRRLIAGGQSSIDAMRAYALENANDPATPFRIYRGGGGQAPPPVRAAENDRQAGAPVLDGNAKR